MPKAGVESRLRVSKWGKSRLQVGDRMGKLGVLTASCPKLYTKYKLQIFQNTQERKPSSIELLLTALKISGGTQIFHLSADSRTGDISARLVDRTLADWKIHSSIPLDMRRKSASSSSASKNFQILRFCFDGCLCLSE